LVTLIAGLMSPSIARAGVKDVPHPFILWTKDEADAIRKRIETEPWADAEYERMLGIRGYGKTYVNLFKYAVMGDEKAGEAERNYLLSFIGARVGPSRRHTQYLSALRYDVLYGTLAPEQRAAYEAPAEVGGVSIAVARKCASTTFVTLHEPFERGRHRIERFERIQQTDHGVAVAIRGKGDSPVNDRAMVRTDDHPDKPLTFAGTGESFTFTRHAWVRVSKEKVEVAGSVKAMNVRVTGQPKLVVNGKLRKAKVTNGVLSFVAR